MEQEIFDRDSEEHVLAVLLVDPKMFYLLPSLEPDNFHSIDLQTVYKAILSLRNENKSHDMNAVRFHLKAKGQLEAIDGLRLLVRLAEAGPASLLGVMEAANRVLDLSKRRKTIKLLTKSIEALNNTSRSAERTISGTVKAIHGMIGNNAKGIAHLSECMTHAFQDIESMNAGEKKILSSGFSSLDRFIAGFAPGELWVVAARPSMGKTATALHIAQSAAKQGAVLFFSLEMSKAAISKRIMATNGKIESHKLRSGDLDEVDWQKITLVMGETADLPFWIDDRANLSPIEIISAVNRWMILNDKAPVLVIVDHLGLMEGCGDAMDSSGKIGEVIRLLKFKLAKEFGFPVLLLSQLNRAVESRSNKRPMLSDLRNSGNIEQDADGVIGLYRDDYYNKESTDRGILEMILLKSRDTATGTAKFIFDGSTIEEIGIPLRLARKRA